MDAPSCETEDDDLAAGGRMDASKVGGQSREVWIERPEALKQVELDLSPCGMKRGLRVSTIHLQWRQSE